MPFIGQQPLTGAYSKLDSITTSATATYNLQLDSAAYSPASANHLLVSLNGVMQAPVDSFTVSGSTITFASALTSSDNIDFIMALGDVLNIGTPSDGTVTAAKIGSGAVTDAKLASTLNLSGKTVTYGLASGDMPAGTVLQVATAVGTSEVSWTGTNIYLGIQASFTPTSATSKIFAMATIQCATSGTGRIEFYFKHNTTSGDNSGTKVGDMYVAQNASASTTALMSATVSTYFTSGTTSPLYVKLCTDKHDGGTGYINKIGSGTNITIMEIAV